MDTVIVVVTQNELERMREDLRVQQYSNGNLADSSFRSRDAGDSPVSTLSAQEIVQQHRDLAKYGSRRAGRD